VPDEIATPARTHMTGMNQRLEPTLTASFRNRMGRGLPPYAALHANGGFWVLGPARSRLPVHRAHARGTDAA
jgi:hypothetical protein